MLALKSYGVVRNNFEKNITLPRISKQLEKEGPFSLLPQRFTNDRSRAHPLYISTCHAEIGKQFDFKDLAFQLPATKKTTKITPRNATFTKSYIAGSFADSSLGSLVRRKETERHNCELKVFRRTVMKERCERAQQVTKRTL